MYILHVKRCVYLVLFHQLKKGIIFNNLWNVISVHGKGCAFQSACREKGLTEVLNMFREGAQLDKFSRMVYWPLPDLSAGVSDTNATMTSESC